MQEYKLFARRIGLIGLTSILVRMSSFISVPILTKTLPLEEYGLWALVGATIGLLPPLMSMGVPFAMVRFHASSRTKEELRNGFYSIFFFVLAVGFLISSILFAFSDKIAVILFDNNVTLVRISVVILFIECISGVFIAFYRTREKVRLYSIFTFLKTYMTVSFAAFFVITGYGIVGAVIGVLASTAIISIAMGVIIIRQIGLPKGVSIKIRDYLVFSLPLLPGKLSSWLVNSSDRYLLGLLLGVVFVGYYAPAYVLSMTISIFVSPLIFMLPVELSKCYDNNEMGKVKSLLYYSNKFFLTLAVPSVFGLSLLSKQILFILTTPQIANKSYAIVPFVAIASMLGGIYSIYAQAIALKKRTKITGSIWILAAGLNVGLNLLLIPLFGIIAAAITTLASFLLAFGLTSYFSLKFIPFDTAPSFMLKAIAASVPMSIAIIYWPLSGIFGLILNIGTAAAIYLISLFLLKGISRKEIMFFLDMLRNQ